MVNEISFPGLFDRVFEINRVAFTIFGKDIMWYAVILTAGFLAAVWYALNHCQEFNWNADRLIDIVLWGLPASVVGCRVYYVINQWDYYGAHPGEIIKTWKGGLGMYGGMLAAALVILIFCKHYKCDMLGMFDMAAMGFMLAQSIGRWANFINAEAHGGPTDLPWGMVINGNTPVHPTFLYESLWTLIGFLFLHFYRKKRKFRGELALMYIGWYGMIRFLLEFLRTDSLFIGHTGIKASQLVGGVCAVISAALLIYMYATKRYPKPFAAQAEGKAGAAPAEPPAQEAPEETPADKPAEGSDAVSEKEAEQEEKQQEET